MVSAKKKESLNDLLTKDVPQGELHRGAGMQLSTGAQTHNRTNAPVRVNRGYRLREDLIKRCKQIALDTGHPLYEIMENALEEYLQKHEGQHD
jgi:hypothetical protein